MVIARDRRSGVSRSIPGGFTLRPERPHPNRKPILAATDTILKAAYALRQAVTFAAGRQRQPKCATWRRNADTGGVAAALETRHL